MMHTITLKGVKKEVKIRKSFNRIFKYLKERRNNSSQPNQKFKNKNNKIKAPIMKDL